MVDTESHRITELGDFIYLMRVAEDYERAFMTTFFWVLFQETVHARHDREIEIQRGQNSPTIATAFRHSSTGAAVERCCCVLAAVCLEWKKFLCISGKMEGGFGAWEDGGLII
jgi:hypothetical protein